MNSELIWRYASVLSITLAAVSGIITYIRKRVNAVLYPFLLCLIIGSINEVLVFIFSTESKNNDVPQVLNNCYILVEFLLFGLFFIRINTYNKKKQLLLGVVMAILSMIWIYEAFILQHIVFFCNLSYFLFSMAISTFSIQQLSMQFWNNYSEVRSKDISYICIVFVVFYTYCAFVMSMSIFIPYSNFLLLEKKYGYFSAINLILKIVNLSGNLAYIILFLWINFRQKYLTASQ